MSSERTTAKSQYEARQTIREPYLQAAHEAAAVTIPHEFPYATDAPKSRYREHTLKPNQEIGARGVNNVAEKIHLTLLPPNIAPMKYEPDPEAKANTDAETLEDIYQGLSIRENVLSASIDAARYRPKLRPIGVQLVIAGNYLINHVNQTIKGYRLDRYVVSRDPDGLPLDIILREDLTYDSLDERAREIVDAKQDSRNEGGAPPDQFRTIEVYTWIKRKGDVYVHHQEVEGEIIPGTEGSSPVDRPQWIAATMYLADGEDYGRGHVEMYQGALETLDALGQAMKEDAIASALTIPLVNPAGQTRIKDMQNARNLEPIPGLESDIGMFRIQKGSDYNTAFSMYQDIKESMSFAFLLNSAIRRNAERVTAEEIRQIAQELDTSLGGFYSTLTEQVQLPIILGHERDLERQGKLPPLPEDLVTPVVLTGLESIGRGQDAINMQLLAQDFGMWAQLEGTQMMEGVKVQNLKERIAATRSVKTEGLFMSEEELMAKQQADQQAMMQQTLVEQGAGPVAGEVAKAAFAEEPTNGSQAI